MITNMIEMIDNMMNGNDGLIVLYSDTILSFRLNSTISLTVNPPFENATISTSKRISDVLTLEK